MESLNMTADDVLARVHRKVVQQSLPIIIFLSIMSSIGISGNLFSLHFYQKKARHSPSVLLIKALAIADTAVCFLCLAVVTEIYYNVLYTSTAACKISYFFHHSSVKFSVYLCVAIAIDRYWLVCRPFRESMTIRSAKWAIVVSLVVSMIMSTGELYSYEIISFPIGNYTPVVYGHRCTVSEDESIKRYILVTHIFDAVGVMVIFFILIFIYGSIVHSLYILKRQICGSSSTSMQKKERSTTLMMFAVSVMFLIFFTPYLVQDILTIAKDAQTNEENTLSRLTYTTVFLNSVVNPLIYCIFNSAFRQYIKKLVCRIPDDESSFTGSDRNTRKMRETLSRDTTLGRTQTN